MKLTDIVTPPDEPIDPGTPEQWRAAETALGIIFPDDYKTLIGNYGNGVFDELGIFSACTTKTTQAFPVRCKECLECDRTIRRYNPAEFPYPPFPERDGLLPCGTTSKPNTIYWLTKGHPNEWPVAISDYRPDFTVIIYQETLSGFLEGIFSGRIHCPLFWDWFPAVGKTVFKSY